MGGLTLQLYIALGQLTVLGNKTKFEILIGHVYIVYNLHDSPMAIRKLFQITYKRNNEKQNYDGVEVDVFF